MHTDKTLYTHAVRACIRYMAGLVHDFGAEPLNEDPIRRYLDTRGDAPLYPLVLLWLESRVSTPREAALAETRTLLAGLHALERDSTPAPSPSISWVEVRREAAHALCTYDEGRLIALWVQYGPALNLDTNLVGEPGIYAFYEALDARANEEGTE